MTLKITIKTTTFLAVFRAANNVKETDDVTSNKVVVVEAVTGEVVVGNFFNTIIIIINLVETQPSLSLSSPFFQLPLNQASYQVMSKKNVKIF